MSVVAVVVRGGGLLGETEDDVQYVLPFLPMSTHLHLLPAAYDHMPYPYTFDGLNSICANKDGNGQGMGRVEQYHTHTRIVDGYIILPIPVPMGVTLYPYTYPMGTHTHWVPNGWIKYYISYSLFYFHRYYIGG
jgi:hypothetical protein